MGLRFSRLCASRKDIFSDHPAEHKRKSNSSRSTSSDSSEEDYVYIANPASMPNINARPRADGRERWTLQLDQIEGYERHQRVPYQAPRRLRRPSRLSNRPKRIRSRPILNKGVPFGELSYAGLPSPWVISPISRHSAHPQPTSRPISRGLVRSISSGPETPIPASRDPLVRRNPRAVAAPESPSCDTPTPPPRRPPMPSFTYSAPSGFSFRTMNTIMEDDKEEHTICTLPLAEVRPYSAASGIYPAMERKWEYVRPGAQSRAGCRSEDGDEVEDDDGREADPGDAWCEYSWNSWVNTKPERIEPE